MEVLSSRATFFIEFKIIYSLPLLLVGGSGNWSDYSNHWATVSGGGTFQSQVPTSNDNVFFRPEFI